MIGKDLFIELIDDMRIQYYNDAKNSDLLKEAFNLNEVPIFDNRLFKSIIKILSVDFDPDEISSYCFERDFGKYSENGEVETSEQFFERLTKL